MQFDGHAVGKHLGEAPEQQRGGFRALALGEQAVDGAERAAGEEDEALGMLGEAVEADLRPQPRDPSPDR